MDLSVWLPVLVIVSSLVPSLLIFFLTEQYTKLRTGLYLGGEVVKLLLVFAMLYGVYLGESYETRVQILPGIDLLFRPNALSMLFLTLSAGLWLLTTLYAIGYLRDDPHRSRFYGFFGLCVTATAGIALAGNLFTFFLFYEMLTLATYPLVVHTATSGALAAGRKYLAYTLGGGQVLLLGIVGLYVVSGPLEFAAGGALTGVEASPGVLVAIFVLLMLGLGVKTALVPLHSWLPTAMVAPTPVSALLHGVAVVKAGAFGILRVVYEIYGVDLCAELDMMLPLALAASFTIVYGSIKALAQDELKSLLAYSTVSQVSYIVFGAALLGFLDTVGALAHLVHQGIMKVTLFFCAGVLAEMLGIKKISEMKGVARRMPWTMAAFTIAAFGMIGLPPTAGFVSKWFLGIGAVETEQTWAVAVLVASTLLNAAYFLPVIYAAYFKAPEGEWSEQRPGTRFEADWLLLFPTLALAGLVLIVGLFANLQISPLGWARLIAVEEWGGQVGREATAVTWSLLDFLWVLPLALPLLLAAALLVPRLRPLALLIAPFSALPALGLALFQAQFEYEIPWLLFGMQIGLDGTTRVFMLFTASLWTLAGFYARSYLKDDPKGYRFFTFYLVTMTGNLGLILAQDLASFYLFFTLMSFAAFGLIVHEATDKALYAARVYQVMAVIGEAFVLPAVLIAAATGTTSFDNLGPEVAQSPHRDLIVVLALVGFGVKAGALLLHMWLPLAHPAAPTPASAVLSGTMIKAGLLGWIFLLPLGEEALPGWGALLVVAGLGAAFYGVAVGLTQKQPKTILAYSSISQMGLMTLAVGTGLFAPAAWGVALTAVLVYATHHALAKGTLFLGVGVSEKTGGARYGLQRAMVSAGLLLGALAIAGAPLTSGAAAKEFLKSAAELPPSAWADRLKPLLDLAAIGSTLLVARFLFYVWPRAGKTGGPAPGLWLPWTGSVVGLAALVLFLPVPAAELPGLLISFSALWPVTLGALLVAGALLLHRRAGERLRASLDPEIPEGDLISPINRLLLLVRGGWRDQAPPASEKLKEDLGSLESRSQAASRRLGSAAVTLEARVRLLVVAGSLALLLSVALIALNALA